MLNQQIAYNSLISVAARVSGLAVSLVTLGFITRYLGQTGFGHYSTVLAFLYLFVVLADFGLYSICVREISRPRADEVSIASNAFTIRFVVGFFVFALAPIAVYFFPYPAHVKWGVLVGLFGYWFMSNHQVLMGVFQKYLRMDRVAVGEVAGRLIHLGLVIFFVQQKMDFLFIIGALVAGSLLNFLLVYYFSRKHVPISFRFDFDVWRRLLKQSLPLALAVIFTVIYFKLDTIMLSLMKPAADVGIYNLAYKFLESLLFFPAMFVGLMMPLLSKYAFLSKQKFREVSQSALDVLLVVIIPLMVGTYFISDRLVVLIGGSDFVASGGVLNVLIVAAAMIFLGALFSNMLISLNKQKSLAYIYGLGAVVNLITNYIFIRKYSYYGAAGTTILTEFLVTFLMVVMLYRATRQVPSFKLALKCIIASVVMGIALYSLAGWPLIVLVAAGGLTYFAFLSLIGGFALKDVLKLARVKTLG